MKKKNIFMVIIALVLLMIIIKFKLSDDKINMVVMGIDKKVAMSEREKLYGNSIGQADAIFLVQMDTHDKTVKVISIPRDTIVTLEKYNSKDKYLGQAEGQIALQYAYADGLNKSCELTVEQVKNILHDIKIDGYISFNLTAISKINDAVGGVDIVLDEDYRIYDEYFKKGDLLYVNGNNIFSFIRYRDTSMSYTAYSRNNKLKLYIEEFLKQFKTRFKQNPSIVIDMIKSTKDDYVFNLDIISTLKVAKMVLIDSCELKDFYILEGTIDTSGLYEEFYPDDNKTAEILKNF